MGEWVGPYIVLSYDAQAKLVLVQASADAKRERYVLVQVKLFLEPAAASTEFMRALHTSPRPFASRKQLTNTHTTEVISKDEERATAPGMTAAIR